MPVNCQVHVFLRGILTLKFGLTFFNESVIREQVLRHITLFVARLPDLEKKKDRHFSCLKGFDNNDPFLPLTMSR